MLSRVVLCLGLWSCLQGGGAESSQNTLQLSPPAITGLSVDCDLENGRWRLEVDTDAWAGGATLLWTVDGDYLEQHATFRSIRAGAGGKRDQLRADLSMVDDFRPAGEGGNTAFTCRQEPSALLWVRALDGQTSDCVRFGPEPGLLDGIEDVPPCTVQWVFDEDDG